VSPRILALAVGAVAVALVALRTAQLAQQSGGGSLHEFVEAVRVAMAEREQELRQSLGLDGTHDAVDAGLS
jgi:hypothetical protein